MVLSVPVGPRCVAFNAHRIFSRVEFLAKFPGFDVEEQAFCDPQYTQEDPSTRKALGELSFYCVVLVKNLPGTGRFCSEWAK